MSNRVVIETLIATPFLSQQAARRARPHPFCAIRVSRARESLWRSFGVASTVERVKQWCRVSGRDSKTMAVGTNSNLKARAGFFFVSLHRVNSSRSCCPCLCVDKMAPRPLSALAIMASCRREGEVRRCGWGWGAAGNGFFFPELSSSFSSPRILRSPPNCGTHLVNPD